MTAFYPAKLVYQTPSVAIGRRDWAISVFTDGEGVMVVPQWRFPGSGWMMPADLNSGIPPSAMSALLETERLIELARVVETELAARRVVS